MQEPTHEDPPATTSSGAPEFNRLFRLALHASPNGILVVAGDGTIAWVNESLERMLGYSRSELLGQAVEILLPPQLAGGHAQRMEGFFRHPTKRAMGLGRDLWALRRDGSTLPVEIGLNPLSTDAGRFVLASVVDITERRGLEERLRSSLGERLEFELVVTEIAATLVRAPAAEVDAVITDSLRRIVEALDLDRSVAFVAEDDDFVISHRWGRSGVAVSTPATFSVKIGFPWFLEQIQKAGIASYSRVEEIPDEVTRASVNEFGARSGVTVGFSIEGRLAGLIAFASTRHEREWSEAVLNRLRLITGVFAGAIARKQADEALVAALAEVKRLSDQLHAENVYLRQEVRQIVVPTPIVGHSVPIAAVLEQARQVAITDSNVLLLGETGTGKELIAAQIHDYSSRHDRLMVRINCAAIPSALIESELFGREKGAYTGALSRQIGRFELADRSTIFLDEIGDLPLEVQVKLLRVLEERTIERLGGSGPIKIDVRVIAATHRNLDEMVAKQLFRDDLYYRLNVFPIRVPPLRERPEDIPLLVWRFIDEFSKRFGKPVDGISRESMNLLQHHPWPGNVRELRNVVERAMIVAKPGRLEIPPPFLSGLAPAAPATSKSHKLGDVETAHITAVLEGAGWRVRGKDGAAERLGLKPSTLETRMAKLGIRRPRPS